MSSKPDVTAYLRARLIQALLEGGCPAEKVEGLADEMEALARRTGDELRAAASPVTAETNNVEEAK